MGDRVAVGGGAAGPQGPGEALRSREWLLSARSFYASQSSHPGSRELNAPHASSNPTHPQCFWMRLAGVGGGREGRAGTRCRAVMSLNWPGRATPSTKFCRLTLGWGVI